jgi:CBS domain-containing membrane protein
MAQPKVVADIMTKDVLFLQEEDNLSQIGQTMERFSLRHLPVVDRGRLVGLVTHRDVLRLAVSELSDNDQFRQERQRRLVENTFVAKIMTRRPRTVFPDTPVLEAAEILVESKFGCLPVVDSQGNLVGIVTEHDFLKLLVANLKRETPRSSPR